MSRLDNLINLLAAAAEGDSNKDNDKQEKTAEQLAAEKAQADALAAAQAAAQAAANAKSNDKKTDDEDDKKGDKVDEDGVIDYKSEFEEQQDDLVLTKVETGLGTQGVDLDLKPLTEFLHMESLKDERGRASQEKIDEFVKAVAGIATKNPPAGQKRTSRKPGMSAYLDEK